MYRVWKKVARRIFCSFLSNGLEFQCEIIHTCLFIIHIPALTTFNYQKLS